MVIKRELTHSLEVAASADDVWAIYGSPDIPRILSEELLPGVFEKMEVLQGDGGVGTIIEIVFHPGIIPRSYKEKFITNDDEKRLKVVIICEGGYLDMGCTSYTDIIHILPTGPNSCIIKSVLIYEVKEECAEAMSSLVSTLQLSSMAEAVAEYLYNKKKTGITRRELTHELEVAASADAVWAIYGSPDIPRILRDELLPGVFEKMEVLEGDGGIGTIIEIVFHPGVIPRSYKEKFITNDNEKRLKVVIICEGGYLDMGCTSYTDIIHIIPTSPNSCIIKSVLIYEVKNEYAEAMLSLVSTLQLSSMAESVANYLYKKKKLGITRRELKHELAVAASADAVWAIYGSHDIPRILRDELLPGVFEKLEVLKGDGGVGTIIEIVFHPGIVPRSYKEKFITNDDKNRLKVVIICEGGYLDMGCTSFTDIIHILPTGPNSCIIKSVLIYEVKDECAEAMSSLISTLQLASMAEAVAKYLAKKKKVVVKRKELTHELEVNASADDVWAIYGSSDIPRLLRDELLPGVYEKMEVLKGDGGVGTIVEIVFHPGAIPRSYKEKLVKSNDEKRLKEVIISEGGYLDMGCTSYKNIVHVLPKGPNSCVIESRLIYEAKEEYADIMASLITTEPLASMAKAVANYVLKKQIRVLGYVIKPKLGYSVLAGLLFCLVLFGVLLIGGVHF